MSSNGFRCSIAVPAIDIPLGSSSDVDRVGWADAAHLSFWWLSFWERSHLALALRPKFDVVISARDELELVSPADAIHFAFWDWPRIEDASSFPVINSKGVLLVIAAREKELAWWRKLKQDYGYSMKAIQFLQQFLILYIPYADS